MSIQDLYDSARAVILQHNGVVGEGNPGTVDPDQFINCLKASGYTSDEVLVKLSHEKIATCLPKATIAGEERPMLGLAETIGKAWRKGPESGSATGDSEKPFVSSKKADRMSNRELLEHFDPTEPDCSVAKRLDKVAKGYSFWIPCQTGVDVALSLESLELLRKFGPHNKNIFVKGKKRYQTYKVGDLPNETAQRNPVWPNRPLRGWVCDQTNRSWEGVNDDVRAFIILGVEMGEIEHSVENAHNLLDLALESNGFDRLKQRYGEVEVEFDKKRSSGDLPKTTMPLKLVVKKEEAAQQGGTFR